MTETTGAEVAEFLIWNIRAYDEGTLEQYRIDLLDAGIPNWRSEDMRFSVGLFDDWSIQRMATYLGERQDAYDAGTLSPQIESILDHWMGDWNSDAARIFAGRTPLNW